MSMSKSRVGKVGHEFKRPSSIHNLVESSMDAHVKDIKLFTTGHLNFNRFTKSSDFKGHYPPKWRSTSERSADEEGRLEKFDKKKIEMMSDAWFHFSLGSSGIIPSHKSVSDDPTFISPLRPSESQKNMEEEVMRKLERQIKNNKLPLKFAQNEPTPPPMKVPSPPATGKKAVSFYKPITATKALVEELKLPELMLSPLNSVGDLPPSLQARREATNRFERKKFITTHLAGITCKDQFHKMLDFDDNILQKSELLDRNIYDGHKAVAHLENKLVAKLLVLQLKNLPAGPSFERLQVYSEVWDDLILDSSMFGDVMKETKREYDNYLAYLLEEAKYSDHDDILRSFRAMDDVTSTSRLRAADTLFQEVDDVELACRNALLKNLALREDIKETLIRIDEEKRMKVEEGRDNMKRLLPRRRKGVFTSSLAAIAAGRFTKSINKTASKESSIKQYRADIWKQIDKIEELKHELRESFVPKTLHRNILHTIKDLEIELQKFHSQEAYLTQHIKDATNLVTHAFDVEQISEEEHAAIWELIKNEDASLNV